MPSWSLQKAVRAYTEYHAHAEFKIRAAAAVGAVGFPLFYVVWIYYSPQPYENIWLRAAGATLCVLLALSPKIPWLRSSTRVLSYVTFVYSLPFFFTLMLLMNKGTLEWQLSAMSALVYTVFLIDRFNIIPAMIFGIACGIACYFWMATEPELPGYLLHTLPIYGFTIVALLALNHSSDVIIDSKMKTAQSLSGYIAHELRTPLSSIRFDAETIAQHLPELVANQRGALAELPAAALRIARQTEAANAIIDTLLFNISGTISSRPRFERIDMRALLQSVLTDYYFKSPAADRLDPLPMQTFVFLGDATMMRHVIYNLLHNAFRAVQKGGGRVSILLTCGASQNSVSILDTGPGIESAIMEQIFIPFRSFNRDSGGTGLGLAFCRIAVEHMGGRIVCNSKHGVGTEFVVSLPAVDVDGDGTSTNLHITASGQTT